MEDQKLHGYLTTRYSIPMPLAPPPPNDPRLRRNTVVWFAGGTTLTYHGAFALREEDPRARGGGRLCVVSADRVRSWDLDAVRDWAQYEGDAPGFLEAPSPGFWGWLRRWLGPPGT
jgi:hypothetical protein